MHSELRRFIYVRSQLQCRDSVHPAVELGQGMKRQHDNPAQSEPQPFEPGGAKASQPGATVEELFGHYSDQLIRYGIGLGFVPEEAEEAAQEGFLRLQRAFRRHESVHNPGAFLHTVVRRLLIDAARQRMRIERFDGHALAHCNQAGNTRGTDAEDLFRLARALLTPRESEVFTRRWGGQTYREISAELGISRGTVGALISRAISKVRRSARHSG